MRSADEIPWPSLEEIIRRDPRGRGLASAKFAGAWLAPGELRLAVEALGSLVSNRRTAAIVTGFCVADSNPLAPETDGPPGAVLLAQAIGACGGAAELVSDHWSSGLLRAGVELGPYGCDVCEFPPELERAELQGCAEQQAWADDFLRRLTADGMREGLLISIERVGPAHSDVSAARGAADTRATAAEFLAAVPVEDRDRCHNMRGLMIDHVTAPLHLLFERSMELRLPVHTIAVADGGNEIGCGKIPWEVLKTALRSPVAARIACRVPTDELIVCGVSNWGAYALAEALLALAGPSDLQSRWPAAQRIAEQRLLIETMVRDGGAIDGVTRRAEPTVDGLSLDEAVGPLAGIQRLVS